jgi:hypothetical protein
MPSFAVWAPRVMLHVACRAHTGLGIPLSVGFRFVEKLLLDSPCLVHLRQPFHAGGFYYCFNAMMIACFISCFIAAALYSTHYTGTALDNESYSATGGNYTANTTVINAGGVLPANGTAADYAGARSNKIDDFTLFATILTLSTVWAIAAVGLLLTMIREYIGTCVSLQTGCTFTRAHFLDHAGDNPRRINIFFSNEQHW